MTSDVAVMRSNWTYFTSTTLH